MDNRRIYLDHAATTPIDKRVVEAMIPFLTAHWGNPSGIYAEAQTARKGLDSAKSQIAGILECDETEIVLTSGGTESDNAAISGVAHALEHTGKHIISSNIEHHAVLHALESLDKDGFEITLIPVDTEGFVDPSHVQASVRDDTILVTIMTANNEVGTIQSMKEIAQAVDEKNPKTIVHTDAVQAAGAIDIRPDQLGVDLLSLTAHKIYGPKGIGALYIRRNTPFQPFIVGGSQEHDFRAGTENVAGAIALATALTLAHNEFSTRNDSLQKLRAQLWRDIQKSKTEAVLHGPKNFNRRLPNNLSIGFPGIEGESILLQLDIEGIAASSGSACTTGSSEPSHDLTAMGIDSDLAHSTVRFTVGTDNDSNQISHVGKIVPEIIERLRALSPT